MSRFGAELKRRRLSAGMSLTTLAAAIPVSKGYLSKVENGKARVNQSLAEACDRAFDARGELAAIAAETARPVRRHSGGMIGLPDDTRHFVGRKTELDSLLTMLTTQQTARVCVVHGMAGVGKTAIALRAARAAARKFPDGCLFFDLQGHTPGASALGPSDVMARILHLLELPGDKIPTDIDGRANLLQDCLRDSRTLLVLDNVRGGGQLNRILPSAPGCRVLVTSRGRLTSVDEAWHLHLGTLPDDEATAVFRSVAGEHVPDNDAVRDILVRCGKLPLAIRIAAARFVVGGWTAGRLRDRLNDETKRLAALDDGERSVAAAFAVSYRLIPPAEQKLFGLLALHPSEPAETASVSAMAGLDDVEDTIDRLHDAHLLTRHPDGYVELHDLMRTFARQYVLPEITAAEQDAAAARLVRHLLSMTVIADEQTEPHRFRPVIDCSQPHAAHFGDSAAALNWLRGQWPVLVEAVELAGARGMHTECWQLAFVLRAFFYREKLLEPWLRTHRRALKSAEAAGDLSATGMILNNLGMAYLELGDGASAVDCHHRAHACFTQAHDERGGVDALSSLAWARVYQGQPEEALRDLTSVLAVYRRMGRTRNVMIALRGVALALTAVGRLAEALQYAEEARSLAELPVDVLMAVNCLAWIHFQADRHDQARRLYQEAIAVAELADSDYERARACTGLGNIAAIRDDPGAARRWWTEADDHQVELSAFTLAEVAARAALSREV